MAVDEIIVRVGADTSEYVRNMEKAQNKTQEFGRVVTAGALSVAASLGTMAVATSMAIGSMVSVASDYQTAFTGIRKTTEGTKEQFDKLSKSIRNMSREMPLSAVEIANVAAVAGQLGIKIEDIEEFTRVMVMMGTATNMSSEEAATSLARFMNIMGTSNKDVERLGSTIVHLGNNLASTESEIVHLGQRLAGAGAIVNMSEADVLAFAGALSSLGIRTEAAGSSFSKVMLEMYSSAKTGGERLELFAKVAGQSANDFKKAFEDDASTAILSFIKGLKRMSDDGENVVGVLQDLELNEIRVRDALLRSSEGYEILEDSLNKAGVAWKENSALSDEAQERYKDFAQKVEILKNRLRDLVLIFGTPMMEVLSDVIDALDPIIRYVENLAAKFEELDDVTKKKIATWVLMVPVMLAIGALLAGLVAGFGLLIITVGVISSVLGVAVSSVWTFLGVLVGVAVAIPLVIAGIIKLVRNWDVLKEKSVEVAGKIKDAFLSLPETIENVVDVVASKLRGLIPDSVVDFLKDAVNNVVNVFSRIGSNILSVMQGDYSKVGELTKDLIPIIAGLIIKGLPGLALAGAKFLPAIVDGITKNFDMIVEVASDIISSLLEGIRTYLPIILSAGVELLETILTGIIDNLPMVIEAITEMFTYITETIAEYLPIIVETGVDILLAIIDGIVEALPYIIEAAVTVIETLIMTVALMIPLLIEVGMELLGSLIDGIIEFIPELIDTIISVVTTIIDTIIELLPVLLEAGIEILIAIVEGIIDAIPEIINGILTVLESVLETIFDNLPKIVDSAFTLGLSLLEGIITSIPEIVGGVIVLIGSILMTFVKNFPKFLMMGLELIWEIIKGIGRAVPQILGAIVDLLWSVIRKITEFFPKLFDQGFKLIGKLVGGILGSIGKVGKAAKDIGSKVWNGIKGFGEKMKDTGKNLIDGLVGGMGSLKDKAMNKAKEIGKSVWGSVKSFFGVKSPSRLFRNELGRRLGEGWILGMNDKVKDIVRAASKLSEAAVPEVSNEGLDIAFATPSGYETSISRAVNGTVDVETRDEALVSAIQELRRDLANLRIIMDGREVGRITEPVISEIQDRDKRVGDRFKK